VIAAGKRRPALRKLDDPTFRELDPASADEQQTDRWMIFGDLIDEHRELDGILIRMREQVRKELEIPTHTPGQSNTASEAW
jgi:hypothetical protein